MMNPTDLKERIAVSDAYTPEERDFLLNAINGQAERTTVVHAPRNYMGRIESIWIVLSVDEGGEGVVAAPIGPIGMTVPLVAADKQRLDSLLPLVPRLVMTTGKVMRLAKFTARQDVEVWRP